MLNSGSSQFFRRFKLYFFGVGMGLVVSYGFFHERYPTWLPGSVILEELNQGEITYTEKAICLMNCGNISKINIGEILLAGDVNFSESDVHREPCPSYAIDGKTKKGESLRIIFAKCDSIAQVVAAINLEVKSDCHCK